MKNDLYCVMCNRIKINDHLQIGSNPWHASWSSRKGVASVSIGITGLKLTVLCTINLFQQSTSNVENSIVVNNNPPNCKFKCYLDK